MSKPIQPPTAAQEFHARFGAVPLPDVAAECKKWETLCTELITQREKLRAELTVAQGEVERGRLARFHEWAKSYQSTFTEEDAAEALAHFYDKPTVAELIAELENAPEK